MKAVVKEVYTVKWLQQKGKRFQIRKLFLHFKEVQREEKTKSNFSRSKEVNKKDFTRAK